LTNAVSSAAGWMAGWQGAMFPDDLVLALAWRQVSAAPDVRCWALLLPDGALVQVALLPDGGWAQAALLLVGVLVLVLKHPVSLGASVARYPAALLPG